MPTLNVVVLKPSKYHLSGYVERFHRGFMPNATLPFISSMLPESIGATRLQVHIVDEYVRTDVDYLDLIDARRHGPTLLLLVGVQSHQFHRALDLAALAISQGAMAVIGGPHAMTCDTSMLQGQGVSFALAEAETILSAILHDAVVHGELQPVYGKDQRWATQIDPPVLKMPDKSEFKRHVAKLLGVYPARGCPFVCNFCSVIKIAGRQIRSQPIETTVATLVAAQEAGVKVVFFTSDNLNKYEEARQLCDAIIDAKLTLRYFIQCDTQIVRQSDLLEHFARAGVYQIFIGVESLNLSALKTAHKTQNKPVMYQQIKDMCDEVGINTHFSMINGFPSDTYESVLEQLGELRAINPSLASFYTLCPIPGTEQYDDFRKQGLITAVNLDRFDTICPTWQHPNLSGEQLNDLFRRCYSEFYSLAHAAEYRPKGNQFPRKMMWGFTLFARYCALSGDHPMSGGIARKHVDHVGEYMPLRRTTYGYEHVPLPDSLRLSASEQSYNDRAKIRVPV